jgi:hypothetical protein
MEVVEVTSLISFVATKLSLAAVYEGCSQAYLTADDGTLISVQLFSDDDEIVLEVQRQSGKGETFQANAKKLLQVSKGRDHVMKMSFEDGRPKKSQPFVIPANLVLDDLEDEVEPPSVQADMDTAYRLVSSSQWDTQELGLGLLTLLTDESKSSPSACRIVCKAVLTEERFGDCLEAIVSAPIVRMELEEESTIASYTQVLKKMTLEVLSNALAFLNKESIQVGGWVLDRHEAVIMHLLNNLKEANHMPHEAVLATRCLEHFMILSSEARRYALAANVAQLVKSAKAIGQCTHVMLEMESQRVYSRLLAEGLSV